MAIPRVFISSTCYDLKHIRENLKYFIRSIGYDPVLSEDGDVYYSPTNHTHDSCLSEIGACNLLILIIGGRFGGTFKTGSKSITNAEYEAAIKRKIPVFALIESSVLSDHHLYSVNNKENTILANEIKYPSVDNIKIFEFIDDVRQHVMNNAIYAFNNFSDIEGYLKKQWAGMMYEHLNNLLYENQSNLTNKLLDDLNLASKKTEELIKELIKATPKSIEGPSKDLAINSLLDQIEHRYNAENFIKRIIEMFKIRNFGVENINKLIN